MSRRQPDRSGAVRALEKLEKIVPPTPLLQGEIGGRAVYFKAESLQPMGAFKLRGAWHRLTDLSAAERERGVVAFSSGNHAQGVAWAARRLGIRATIVMPADSPAKKLDNTRALGAEVVTYDRMTESREAIAARIAEDRGSVVVPSFDDPWVVEGQGSAGLEACRQMAALGVAPPDRIVTPCGGGGLASGLALAVPEADLVIAEPEGWDDMTRSLAGGEIVPVGQNPPPTACDALQTLKVAPLTFDILKVRGVQGVAVTEAETAAAMRWAFDNLRLVLEPGGAVALAALLAGKTAPAERTLVILSGGNVDASTFRRMVVDH
ncbi:threonine/serine dehydratase [Sphingomonas horti]|uniref:threonine ammonia-lyase n=1 Tax=Sphingomonas TaxID=13687 RepID=UPI0038CDAE79